MNKFLQRCFMVLTAPIYFLVNAIAHRHCYEGFKQRAKYWKHMWDECGGPWTW